MAKRKTVFPKKQPMDDKREIKECTHEGEVGEEAASVIDNAQKQAASIIDDAETEAAYIVARAADLARDIITEAKNKSTTEAKRKSTVFLTKAIIDARRLLFRVRSEARERRGQAFTFSKVIARAACHTYETAKNKGNQKAQHIVEEAGSRISTAQQIAIIFGQAVREAKGKTKSEAERIINQKREAKQFTQDTLILAGKSEVRESHPTRVKLVIMPKADFTQIIDFKQHLLQIPELLVLSVGGSTEGTEIIISFQQPTSLVQILEGMPIVETLVNRQESIIVTLREIKSSKASISS